MRLEKISYYQPHYSIKAPTQKEGLSIPANENKFQTSVYNQKGVTVPFCGLAKAGDEFEALCIKALRKARNGRVRKFAEDDIQEMLQMLKRSGKPDTKFQKIQEVLEVSGEYGEKPDKKTIKKILSLTAERPENERFAILDYAENEMKNAIYPLQALKNISGEKQNKIIEMLCQVNDVNNTRFYKCDEMQNETINSLYDHVRSLIYAGDDLRNLPPEKSKSFKLDTMKELNEDIKYFQRLDTYSYPKAKEKVLEVAENIFKCFIDNYL